MRSKRVDLAERAGSIFHPLFLGVDEFGIAVFLPMMYRNILIGGEPNSGKSAVLNNIVAAGAMATDCCLVLIDGKQVELGQWKRCADVFVGPDVRAAIGTLRNVQTIMDNRYTVLLNNERRNTQPGDVFGAVLLAIDEIAYFSATAGDKKTQDAFSSLLRDLIARRSGGRHHGGCRDAAAVVGHHPAQPAGPVRVAVRVPVHQRRVVGHHPRPRLDAKGWSANSIDPLNPGTGLLIAEGGIPKRVKAAYLSDDDCARIAAHAATLRVPDDRDSPHRIDTYVSRPGVHHGRAGGGVGVGLVGDPHPAPPGAGRGPGRRLRFPGAANGVVKAGPFRRPAVAARRHSVVRGPHLG